MDFLISPLSQIRVAGIKSCVEWSENCPVSLDRLVSVKIIHKDFKGHDQSGELIVLDVLAENVLTIFTELYELAFPIHSAIPVDEFGGDDVLTMNANNSSAFNCRRVMNTDRWSSHAYGAAIDINPVQNPYVLINDEAHTAKIYPNGGTKYLNRGIQEAGMVEAIAPIFKKHGFKDWGGAWRSPLDYHHFQVEWDRIRELILQL
jgi:hypothetical protein